MTPKFSKQDAYRTSKTIVGLAGSPYEFYAQFLFKGEDRVGEYEGQNYWNCFDIYDVNDIRFHIGNGAKNTKNFSYNVLKELGEKAEKLHGWSNEDIIQRKELLKEFCDSIHKGIHDPSPINNFTQFKKQLVEQKDMWPEKSWTEIGKLLNDCVTNKGKEAVNAGLGKAMTDGKQFSPELFASCKNKNEELGCLLHQLYRIEKERQQKKELKIESGFER